MKGDPNLDFLAGLFAQIERAWFDRHERTIVYQLSEQYPEFRDQLYEFFEDIVLGPGDEASMEIEDAEERVHQWLQSSGLEIARNAASDTRAARVSGDQTSPSPETNVDTWQAADQSEVGRSSTETWLTFLRRRIGQRVPQLAKSLPNVTAEYLVLISRHPNVVPERIKRTFAQYLEEHWQVPAQECLLFLTNEPKVLRAASRSRPYEPEPSNFEELLDRSALSAEQKAFWLEFTK